MTRKTRRILFWLAVAFFVAATPIIVSYARGYRLDFSGLALSQVGAIALETRPKEAAIWLNNKKLPKTTPTIIRNLFPERNYGLRVEREGFWPWQKELTVEAELITTARNIILFPQELKLVPALDEATTTASTFSLSPNAEYVLRHETNGGVSLTQTATKERVRLAFTDRLRTVGIRSVRWSQNGNRVVFNRVTSRGERWYLTETGTGALTDITAKTSAAKDVLFSDPAGSKIVALISDKVLTIDLEQNTISDLKIEDIEIIDAGADRILVFKKPDILLTSTATGEPITLYGNLRFVPDNILISPDGKKVAFWHNWHIGVFWLEDSTDGLFRKRGEQEIVFPSLSPIKRVRWHDSSEYLMAYLENNEFSVVELDGRGENHNTWTWKPPETISFDYADRKEELWFLDSNGELLRHAEKF